MINLLFHILRIFGSIGGFLKIRIIKYYRILKKKMDSTYKTNEIKKNVQEEQVASPVQQNKKKTKKVRAKTKKTSFSHTHTRIKNTINLSEIPEESEQSIKSSVR
jgi:hypothetical protein